MRWGRFVWVFIGIAGALGATYVLRLWSGEVSWTTALGRWHMPPFSIELLQFGWPVGLLIAVTLALGAQIRQRIGAAALGIGFLVIPVAIAYGVHFWMQSGVALGVLLWTSIWSATLGAKLVPERVASRGGLIAGEALGGLVGLVVGLLPMFASACRDRPRA